MTHKKTCHACDVTGSDNSYGELQVINYQKPSFDASEYAMLWIAKTFRLPLPAARLIAALASLGGGA